MAGQLVPLGTQRQLFDPGDVQAPHTPGDSDPQSHIENSEGQNQLPHTYWGGQLDICVHDLDDWNSKLLVADTIMPWVSQWLRFYECWEQTGSWEGKGTHPESRSHESKLLPSEAA